MDGKLGMEAYLRDGKLFDYSDGRFSNSGDELPFDEDDEYLLLDGDAWQVNEGHNRLGLSLVRYWGHQHETVSRIFVNFRVNTTQTDTTSELPVEETPAETSGEESETENEKTDSDKKQDEAPNVHAEVRSFVIRINGKLRHVRVNATLDLTSGDEVELVRAIYKSERDSLGAEGVLAVEGYLREDGDYDYEDGRFGETNSEKSPFHKKRKAISFDKGDAWTIDRSHDRLAVALIHYYGDSHTQMDTAFIHITVDRAEILFRQKQVRTAHSMRAALEAGEQAVITADVANKGQGQLTADAQVTVFERDTDVAVWEGTMEVDLEPQSHAVGEFLDANGQRWVPQAGGHFRVRFHLDPHEQIEDANRDNNLTTKHVMVHTLSWRDVDVTLADISWSWR